MEKKLKEHFKTLGNHSKISEVEFKCICSIGTRPGVLCRLPKVHKIVTDNIPKFRPISSGVSKIFSSYFNTVNDYTVKDSFSFAKEDINFDHKPFMEGLDVESSTLITLPKQDIFIVLLFLAPFSLSVRSRSYF